MSLIGTFELLSNVSKNQFLNLLECPCHLLVSELKKLIAHLVAILFLYVMPNLNRWVCMHIYHDIFELLNHAPTQPTTCNSDRLSRSAFIKESAPNNEGT